MAYLEDLLSQRLATAFEAVAQRPVDPVVRRSQHADFQSDAALGLARALGSDPRSIAGRVVAAARLDDVCAAVEVSGPGFINLTVADDVLGQMLADTASDERLGIARSQSPGVITVDYSAPNAAKEMHVGHLRSTIIGDAAVRLLEWRGNAVVRQNHIGEWGTPFGMLIEHLLDIGEAEAAHELSVGDLNGFYQAARRKFDADKAFKDRARRRVVALQRGDPTTRHLWEVLVGESKKYFATVYSRLRVQLTDDDYFGESFYNDQLKSVVDELESLGMVQVSEGAKCVFPAGFTGRDGRPLPLIVQKRDGGYGYAATDLATIRHRIKILHATRLLYVVGLPQAQHLQMIFQTAREAGWLVPPVRAEHIGHGSVLGSDGKMLRTRAGVSVKLADLLDEAVNRAMSIVEEKNPGLGPAQQAAVAEAVGIGAVKYADLSIDRTKDYVFDLDRMLALDGNTATYLQYARARICSIFRKGDVEPNRQPKQVTFSEPAERALAMELLGFGVVIEEVTGSLEFHKLANYLHALASVFSTFFEQCPVLKSEGDTRESRLVLCDLTARTLQTGLGLLGIDSPDQM
ncbi:MAG TPA: arginine--tRNA ligase [Streptosporangiaceae bacterium]|nr:arginine--tRNA ligase [Streptosporangiaceae bacterium]